MTKNKTLIAGAGNLWRHDDGIGIVIIQKLRELAANSDQSSQNYVYLKNTDLIDIGTDGLALLDILPNYYKAIIIDAVDMGSPPGTIKTFTPKEAKIKITNDALSTHGFGLAEMLKLAEELSIATKITIIGIQPQDLSFGEGLSQLLTNTIPQIISLFNKIN